MSARTPFLAVRELAMRMDEEPGDYDAELEMESGRRFVLIG